MKNVKLFLGILLLSILLSPLCTNNSQTGGSDCLGEGQSRSGFLTPREEALVCCPGLKWIPRVCGQALDGGSICAKCGDGRCGTGENKCNCPSDCSRSCASEGESVFDVPVMGPAKCCDAAAGVNPLIRINKTYNICSNPDSSGSKGICSKSWAQTCGNGVCDSIEDKCNCLQDCPPSECAGDGEQVYNRPIDGPVRCCSADSGIKYDHRPDGEACTAVSGQFSPVGVCVPGWQKTCGDGSCGPGEDRCNCHNDCGNSINTSGSNESCIKEGEYAGRWGDESPQCCAGLSKIGSDPRPDGKGGCMITPAGFTVCANCGDGNVA